MYAKAIIVIVAGFICLFSPTWVHAAKQDQPNIVWIVTEDNSKHWLRLYEQDGVEMPNVERLAANGLVFNHAFSNSPVCSVARSTLISGCYAPRVGAQYHRRTKLVPMPDGVKMFPHYLRQAGYYTTNNSKEDYNFLKTKSAWDESSRRATYRNRRAGQPFFHVQNFGTTHEGKLHFPQSDREIKATTDNPDELTPFPYHPNTSTVRYTYARQRDNHRTVDKEIGRFLQQLEGDSLLEETIIFYYGDHGGVLPRSKGYLYESGLHVPLVITVPERWRHLFPAGPGNRIDGYVSFVDFAPTVLELAGIEVPDQMDGKPFLGKEVALDELNRRETAFGYADRFDEKYDLVRSWRRGKYKYIRNYQPFNIDALYNQYRYRMLAYREWEQLSKQEKINVIQQQFFRPRPAEQLFDIEKDPHETVNLAQMPQHAETVAKLRDELHDMVSTLPDLSFVPEPYFVDHVEDPVEFGQEQKERIRKLVDVADLSLHPFEQVSKKLKVSLSSEDSWERYWALIVCSSFGQQASKFAKTARQLAKSDPQILVRVRAAEFLGLTGIADPRPVIQEALKSSSGPTEANLILNSAVLLETTTPRYDFQIDKSIFPQQWKQKGNLPRYVNDRVDYLNANKP